MLKRERNKTNKAKFNGTVPPTGPKAGNTKHYGGSGVGKTTAPTEGRWAHDLHHKNNPLASRIHKPENTKFSKSGSRSKSPHTKSNNPLSASITPSVAASLSGNRLFAALHGDIKITPAQAATMNVGQPSGTINIRGASRQGSGGLSIKGMAGPFVVRASNFAPGTTAEDIKTALMGLGKINSCIILSANPTVLAEIVFDKKEAADACVAKYNNQIADGRRIHLFLHDGPPIGKPPHNTPTPLRDSSDMTAARAEADRVRRLANQQTALSRHIVDGTQGFKAPMLYSDSLIQRRGRGFQGK